MRSASLLALPFLRGPRLWTQRGLRHRTQLGGLPNAGFRDEARDVLRGRYVEGRVPRRTLLRGDSIRSEQDEVHFAAAEESPRGPVRNDGVLDPFLQEFPRGEPRALQPGTRLVDVDEEAAPLLLRDPHRSHRGPVVDGR